jgi:hypothetical protein
LSEDFKIFLKIEIISEENVADLQVVYRWDGWMENLKCRIGE